MDSIEVEEVRLEGSCDWDEFAESTEGVEAEVDEDREEKLRPEFCNREMLGCVGCALPLVSSSSSSSSVASSVSLAASSLRFSVSAVYSSYSCTTCSREGVSRFSKLALRLS